MFHLLKTYQDIVLTTSDWTLIVDYMGDREWMEQRKKYIFICCLKHQFDENDIRLLLIYNFCLINGDSTTWL